MTQQNDEALRSFIDEAKHLTTNLNVFVSDMIRDKNLVHQLDHDPSEVASRYNFTKAEIAALRERDMPQLYRLGLHPFLLVRFAGMVGILEYWKALGRRAEETERDYQQMAAANRKKILRIPALSFADRRIF